MSQAVRARPGALGWAGIAALGAGVGGAVALGGRFLAAAGAAVLLVAIIAVLLNVRTPARPGAIAIEIPAVLLLVSNLVFRIRETNAIASNPLDAAGIFRTVCLGLGSMLCVAGLLMAQLGGGLLALRRARPLWTYLAYVAVAYLGIVKSVYPLLTAFRAVNLTAVVLVVLTAFFVGGEEGLERLEKVIFWFIVAHLSTAWLGALVAPAQAIRSASPFPFRIEGVFPALSSDRIGEYGVILFMWCYAARNGIVRDRVVPSRAVSLLVMGFGIASLLAAQYRTGYVMMGIGILLILAIRGRAVLAGVLASLGVFIIVFGQTLFAPLLSLLLRGQSVSLASKLSGRNTIWSAAIPVWRKSPIIGSGLETASRFEVLASIGRGFTGTVHGTWIEALIGTGIVGTILLAATVVMFLVRAYAMALRTHRLAPILVGAAMVVRSITGTSFETFGLESILFLTLVMAVRKPQLVRVPGDRRRWRLRQDDDGPVPARPSGDVPVGANA